MAMLPSEPSLTVPVQSFPPLKPRAMLTVWPLSGPDPAMVKLGADFRLAIAEVAICFADIPDSGSLLPLLHPAAARQAAAATAAAIACGERSDRGI
jgi:hypothetical protein